jgi:predicted patatin/cPLA2 family phospholipase
MRALVISGGGSKGAFAGGIAEYLIAKEGIKYDLIVGCSTGSLLAPLLALGQIDRIREAYTTITQQDIYSVLPFSVREYPDGTFKSKINHFNTLMMFIKGKKTFGETKSLRTTIGNILTEPLFEKAKAQNLKVAITVSNLSQNRIEYKYLADNTYEDFCDWMWASTCFVPFMSIVEKNGFEYADGGFGNYVPIEEAIDAGATDIDVIILRPKTKEVRKSISRNPFDVLLNSMDFMLQQIVSNDIYIGQLESIYNRDLNLRFFFTPRVLTEHSFYFKPELMHAWWAEGYKYAGDQMKLVQA